MAADINNIKINSDKETILKRLEERAPVILEKIGLIAERYAKMKCPVDTGRLRNSITHAVGGKGFSVGSYHASKGATGKSAGSKGAGSVKMGFYSGSPGSAGDDTVYIGTNVEYAPYVELGSLKQRAKPYLKPAILNHINEYNELIRNELAKD